jgi:hypothetical protein
MLGRCTTGPITKKARFRALPSPHYEEKEAASALPFTRRPAGVANVALGRGDEPSSQCRVAHSHVARDFVRDAARSHETAEGQIEAHLA